MKIILRQGHAIASKSIIQNMLMNYEQNGKPSWAQLPSASFEYAYKEESRNYWWDEWKEYREGSTVKTEF